MRVFEADKTAGVHKSKETAAAKDARHRRELAELHALLQDGSKSEDAKNKIKQMLVQGGIFCSTVATVDGSPQRTDKASAVSVHAALATSIDPQAAINLNATEQLTNTPIVGVDALQTMRAAGQGTTTPEELAQGQRRAVLAIFLSAMVILWFYDKGEFVPEAKGMEQGRRSGEDADAYAISIAESSLRQRPLTASTPVKLATYMRNRSLRGQLEAYVVGSLSTMQIPPGKTLIIDSGHGGLQVIGAPLPNEVLEKISGNKLGEADLGLFAYLLPLSMCLRMQATSRSTDADGFPIGLLSMMLRADPVTGTLPRESAFTVAFSPTKDHRRRFQLDALFHAIIREGVCGAHILLPRPQTVAVLICVRLSSGGALSGRVQGRATWRSKELPPFLAEWPWWTRIICYVLACIAGGNDFIERTALQAAGVILSYLMWSVQIGPIGGAAYDASERRWSVHVIERNLRRLFLVVYATRHRYRAPAIQAILEDERVDPRATHDKLRHDISDKLLGRETSDRGAMPTYTATGYLVRRIEAVLGYYSTVLRGEREYPEENWTTDGGGYVRRSPDVSAPGPKVLIRWDTSSDGRDIIGPLQAADPSAPANGKRKAPAATAKEDGPKPPAGNNTKRRAKGAGSSGLVPPEPPRQPTGKGAAQARAVKDSLQPTSAVAPALAVRAPVASSSSAPPSATRQSSRDRKENPRYAKP